jgi:hypothetical protein
MAMPLLAEFWEVNPQMHSSRFFPLPSRFCHQKSGSQQILQFPSLLMLKNMRQNI